MGGSTKCECVLDLQGIIVDLDCDFMGVVGGRKKRAWPYEPEEEEEERWRHEREEDEAHTTW